MPVYRTLNLTDKAVTYVIAANKAQARSHVARKIVQVELADPNQMMDDAADKVSLVPETAGEEK